MLDYLAVGPDVFERRTQSLKEPRPEMAWLCSRERLQPYETLEGLLLTRKRGQKMRTRDLWRKEAITSPETKTRVRSRSLDPIDSIGWLLSITVGHILPGEGIT